MTEIMLQHTPSAWKRKRLGQLFRERREKVSDKDFPPLSVTKQGILPQLDTAAKTGDGENRKGVRAGDFVINSRSDRKGSSGISDRDGSVSLINIVLQPRKLEPRFAHHLLRSSAFQEEFYRWGHGIVADLWTTRYSEMKNILLAVPERTTQKAIADFLDRETAKIDSLIEKKQRLIELLEEKRSALITQAVTKGLDPNVPMKDSGVEWVGELPGHWDVVRLKQICRLETGHTPSRQKEEYWQDCTIPWFGLADVWQIRDGRRTFVRETKESISEIGLAHSSARLLPKGTVILSRTASVGFSAILGVPMATTQDFVNWVCGPLVEPAFLLYVLRAMQPEFRRLTMGSTHQTIYMPDVHRFVTPLPPLGEQKRITKALQSKAKTIFELIDRVKEASTLLREYRTALVSAAVTGRIDVRERDP